MAAKFRSAVVIVVYTALAVLFLFGAYCTGFYGVLR